MIRFLTQAIGNHAHILNRGALYSRTMSNIKKPYSIFQASFAITLGNSERNRLGPAQPMIASMATMSLLRPRSFQCSGDVFDRKAIDVKPIVVKEVICHDRLDSITSTVALSTSRTDMLHPLDVLNNQEDFGKNMGACNMERPAFRRRIAFIEAGRIDRTRLV